jgi:hypothetical protein
MRKAIRKAAIVAVLGACIYGAAAATATAAQQPGADDQGSASWAPAASAARAVTTTATVTRINKAAGTLTLKDAQGKRFEVKAGPRVKLERLAVGQRVRATYYEEIAVAIDRATRGAPKMTHTTVERGGVAARQATETAHVVSVDPKSNTVAIRTPDGSTHTLHVQDPDLQSRLKHIKPGDDFDITYTQAVALSVHPRK